MYIPNYVHTYARTTDEVASIVAGGCAPCQQTDNFAVVSEAPAGEVTWSGIIGVENELTGDGRFIEMNALTWDTPIPLRYAPVDTGGHDGAQVVGRILTIERKDNGDIFATGDLDMASPLGPEAARVVGNQTSRGVSMDLDSVGFEIRVAKEILESMEENPLENSSEDVDDNGLVTVMEMGPDDEVMVTTTARVRAATLVAIPAFARANIDLDNAEVPENVSDEEPALVAGATPAAPPAEWFRDPNLSGPTPLTITEDGRVFGHLAVWGTCHTAYAGQCVEPPHSPSGYAYFRTGAVLTADGTEVATGVITLDTLHAKGHLKAVDTLAHYEHTGKGAADVAVGEDTYGIWIAGAARPGLPDEKVRVLRASPLSGDWRRIGGQLELVAALAVNSPGFPVPRPQGLVASGAMQSLVASGVMLPPVAPKTSMGVDTVALATAVADEMERRERVRKARQLAARTRTQRAHALAARVGVR